MIEEVWLPVKEFRVLKKIEGTDIEVENYKYEVSSLGNVRNATTKRILVQKKVGKNQSLAVALESKEKGATFRTVAQLVANAFIPNPNNYPIVAHKNRDKLDNRVSNLEWTSSKILNQRVLRESYLTVHCSNGKTYQSVLEASEDLNVSTSIIRNAGRKGKETKEGLFFIIDGVEVEKKRLEKIENLEGECWSKMEGINPLFEISNKGRVKRIEVGDREEKLLEPVLVDNYVVTNLCYTVKKNKYKKQISPMKEAYKAFGVRVEVAPSKNYSLKK